MSAEREANESLLYSSLFEKYGNIMRTHDIAKELHCHPSHVRAMCQTGQLPGVRVGSRWMIPTAKFANLLENPALMQ